MLIQLLFGFCGVKIKNGTQPIFICSCNWAYLQRIITWIHSKALSSSIAEIYCAFNLQSVNVHFRFTLASHSVVVDHSRELSASLFPNPYSCPPHFYSIRLIFIVEPLWAVSSHCLAAKNSEEREDVSWYEKWCTHLSQQHLLLW